MGILNRLLKRDRKFWFVCHTCMMQTDHDTLKSVFHYEGPPIYILGRPLTKCPRCQGTNTRSFQQLKEEGSESALWGLEQLVRKYPTSRFEIHPTKTKVGG